MTQHRDGADQRPECRGRRRRHAVTSAVADVEQLLLGRRAAIEAPRHAPLVEHHDPVAQAHDLGQLGAVLTKVLTSAKGVTLTMEATDRLHGKIRLDLGESPTPIKDVARALIIEVLEKRGLLLDEMKDWRLLVEVKAISLEGRMSSKGLKTLTEMIPFPIDTVDLKQAGSKQGESANGSPSPSSPGDAKLTASKKYFERITERLRDLRVEVKGAQKAKFAQKMLSDASHEIDRLPVLNVDEELLAYGAGVSSSLRGMREPVEVMRASTSSSATHRPRATRRPAMGTATATGDSTEADPSPAPPPAPTARRRPSCRRTSSRS